MSRVRIYTVRSGDSMWLIAQRLLGDGRRLFEIADINDVPHWQVDDLPVGLELRIPRR